MSSKADSSEITEINEEIVLLQNNKADLSEGEIFIVGGGTTDGDANTSAWTGSSSKIRSYFDGLTIKYKVGVVGESTTTLNINGLGARTVYRFSTTKLTTQFPVGSIIRLTYHESLNSGCWMCNDYDANTNTYQRVYETSTNKEYAITTRYNTTDGSSYYAEYGRYTNGVTINPSTNTVTATTFKGDLTGTATKATQDANGNTITSTYETKSDATTKFNQLSTKIDEMTPIKGEDYWTEEDVESIVGEANVLIADEMAKKAQLKPEFTNSVEGCEDTTKLYVLPDNHIYAYTPDENTYTNWLPISTDTDGTIYNGKGFKEATYLSSSSGLPSSSSGAYVTTGLIPIPTLGDVVLNFANMQVGLNDSYVRLCFYDTKENGYALIECNDSRNWKALGDNPYNVGYTLDANGEYVVSVDATNRITNQVGGGKNRAAYVRLCALGIDADSIITVNEEIPEGIVYTWQSTGHEFISIPTEDPIVQEIIKDNVAGLRVKPEFVNSVEECIDTNKVYVLPDGYIYTYTTGLVENWENVVATSTAVVNSAPSTDIYNGVGYRDGYRLTDLGSNATGESQQSGYTMTGGIPYTGQNNTLPEIYVKGLPWTEGDSNVRCYMYIQTSSSSGYAIPWDAVITGTNGKLSTYFTYTSLGDNYWKLSPNVSAIETAVKTQGATLTINNLSVIRFSLKGSGANLIISLNEPIESTIETTWRKTQCTFAPADYEDRIIKSENKIRELTAKVATLEAGGANGEGVESYVQEEAERVAKKVYSHQNANTFSFLAISDMHYHTQNAQIIKSDIHAGQGMDLVRKGVNIDFAVCLGDTSWGSGIEGDSYRATMDIILAELRSANKCLDSAFRGIPNFRTIGNHDNVVYNHTINGGDYLDGNELFPLFGAYNRGAVYPDDKSGGYCYRDFDDWKLRVICVNTTDNHANNPTANANIYVSPAQLQWFANTLDLSSKSDANKWSILIVSHTPIEMVSGSRMSKILEAYGKGTTYSDSTEGVAISYNYSGKNKATIIANVHGHNHNYQVANLRKLTDTSTSPYTTQEISPAVKRICVPNACYSRMNERSTNGTVDQWDIEYGDSTPAGNKIADSAQDTAFNVFTIDPVARKIYATNYGYGGEAYDRVIDY